MILKAGDEMTSNDLFQRLRTLPFSDEAIGLRWNDDSDVT